MSLHTTSTPGISSNISVIVRSHTLEADDMPKGIRVYLKQPNAELNVRRRDIASVTLFGKTLDPHLGRKTLYLPARHAASSSTVRIG